VSASETSGPQERPFESPAAQKLLRHLKGDSTVEFRPSFDSKTGQIAFPDAERITELDPMKTRVLLDFFAEQGILSKRPTEAFYTCPNCESRNLILLSACTYCGSESLMLGRGIEHLRCGHVDLEEAFMSKDGLKCPKCGKILKAIGVDYRRIGNYYRCLNCKRLVEKPVETFACSNCQKRTPFGETRMSNSSSYYVNPEAGPIIQKHALDLVPINGVFEKHGFNTKTYVIVKGRSGVPQHADILAWYKEIPESEEKPDLVMDVVIQKEPLSEESMSAFIMKTIDIGSQNGVLVATPDLSPLAAKLASFYGIVSRGCESVGEIPGAITNLLAENLPKIVRRKVGEEETQQTPRLEKSLLRHQANKTEDQLPVLLAMIYEKQGESQRTMRKLLEYLESHDKRLEGILQRLKEEKPLSVE
jgi:uncharacterized protein YlaI